MNLNEKIEKIFDERKKKIEIIGKELDNALEEGNVENVKFF